MTNRIEIQIDHDIPIPSCRKNYHGVYPLQNMNVGDSFLFKNQNKQKAYLAVGHYRRKHGGKFKVAIDDNGKLRCWRIE